MSVWHPQFVTLDGSMVPCPSLLYPDKGTLRIHRREAIYDCQDGYTLVGNIRRYCQKNGKWTGEEPFCRGIP